MKINQNKIKRTVFRVDNKAEKIGDKLYYNGFERTEMVKDMIADLKPYEIFASKRKIENPKEVKIPIQKIIKAIEEAFNCSICLYTYEDPVCLKNCMHVLCKKCFEESAKGGKKACPLCKKEYSTKRDFREDKRFKGILKLLLPFTKILDEDIKLLIQSKNYLHPNNSVNSNLISLLNSAEADKIVEEPDSKLLGKKTLRDHENHTLNDVKIDTEMKMEDMEYDFTEAEEGASSHDLNSEEIEKNKHNFTELTSIKFNFEPELLKINTGFKAKSFSDEKKIKDMFKNHRLFIENESSLEEISQVVSIILKEMKLLEREKLEFYVYDCKNHLVTNFYKFIS